MEPVASDMDVQGRLDSAHRRQAEDPAQEESREISGSSENKTSKGNRRGGSFKDPLQDQLTPANVDLSSRLMTTTSEMDAEPHLKNTFSSKKIGLEVSERKFCVVFYNRRDRPSVVQNKTNAQ